MYFIRDFITKKQVTPKSFVFTGENAPWEIVMDLDKVRQKINFEYFRQAPSLVSKYLPFMPIQNHANFVSLREGQTPLLTSKTLGKSFGMDLRFKLEPNNPTGSFKDRGSAVDLTVAKELGAKAISVASTGNMAASCACYAASAQMPCFVFVPEGTPPSKLSQVIAFGGKIVQVKGTYNDAAKLAQHVAEELGFFLAGDYAFRIEGAKTVAFEIVDQLFYQVPDVVIVPIGCGTNLAALWKGFVEYHALRFIDKLPRIIGVQASGACPVVNSFEAGRKDFDALKSINTIASAIAVSNPLDGAKALAAIYESRGEAISVTDNEMLEAQYLLSKEEGHFVEVSCASAIAALKKLSAAGKLGGERVVCILTGAGLKDPSTILRGAIQPPTIYPEVKEFLSLYNGNFFAGKSVAFFDKAEVVFKEEPTLAQVEDKLKSYFSASYPAAKLERIRGIIVSFLKKGKQINFADLQDIVQDALETIEEKRDRVFFVDNFKITTGKDIVPEAEVEIRVRGEKRSAKATGVGPVDAVINALREACGSGMNFALVSYRVSIRSEGTDAVTAVELKLKKTSEKLGDEISVGTGTSPDVIQASIEAFDEAYNGFKNW